MEVGDSVVDVRVAAWLLDPDACGSSSVSDSLELDSKVHRPAWKSIIDGGCTRM